MSDDDEGVTVAQITITRYLTDDPGERGDRIRVETSEGMALVDTLGMLRFAEDSVIRDSMDEEDEP